MQVNFDCSCMWVRDAGPLKDALSLTPEYLRAKGNHLDFKVRLRGRVAILCSQRDQTPRKTIEGLEGVLWCPRLRRDGCLGCVLGCLAGMPCRCPECDPQDMQRPAASMDSACHCSDLPYFVRGTHAKTSTCAQLVRNNAYLARPFG